MLSFDLGESAPAIRSFPARQLLHGLRRQPILKGGQEELVPVLALGLQALEQSDCGVVSWDAGHSVRSVHDLIMNRGHLNVPCRVALFHLTSPELLDLLTVGV
jgi:hypothetical protein